MKVFVSLSPLSVKGVFEKTDRLVIVFDKHSNGLILDNDDHLRQNLMT